jgi:hypothetical protein
MPTKSAEAEGLAETSPHTPPKTAVREAVNQRTIEHPAIVKKQESKLMSESLAQHVGSRLSFEKNSTNYGSCSCDAHESQMWPIFRRIVAIPRSGPLADSVLLQVPAAWCISDLAREFLVRDYITRSWLSGNAAPVDATYWHFAAWAIAHDLDPLTVTPEAFQAIYAAHVAMPGYRCLVGTLPEERRSPYANRCAEESELADG